MIHKMSKLKDSNGLKFEEAVPIKSLSRLAWEGGWKSRFQA